TEVTAHRMAAAVPPVERTHDADAARIGRPHGKHHARHIVDRRLVRAEPAIQLEVIAFGDEVEIHRAERWRKPVWIFDVLGPLLEREAEPIGKRLRFGEMRDEET